jgi:ribosomal-protein-alanine N-acetyltransferase
LSDLRAFGPEDVAAAADIDRRASASPWTAAQFQRELTGPHSRGWALVERAALVGYAFLWMVADEGQLANLAVTEAQRRRGGGARLLERLLDEARRAGARRVTLEVREGNAPARALYEKHGFLTTHRRPAFYENREAALLMERALE